MIIKRVMIVALVIIGTWCAQAGYTDDCVTFSSEASFTLDIRNEWNSCNVGKAWDGTLWISTDKTNWTEWNGGKVSAKLTDNTGSYNLYVRGNANNTTISGTGSCGYKWVLTGSAGIACTGNIETLRGATGDAPSLTKMADYCYYYMFYGCTLLTHAPALPATTLAGACYASMFSGCTSLTCAPMLPATTLKTSCCYEMFRGCTSLTSAPMLPAMTLAEQCYSYMFSDCTALTSAPALPATMLADECYSDMFSDCTALTNAPALPATSLAFACYKGMFSGCTSLLSAPVLSATTMNGDCYRGMFAGCTSLTDAPTLPAKTLSSGCYSYMFRHCTSLTSVPMLPATTLARECYMWMFSDCTALTNAPALPATMLVYNDYNSMFLGCTSLTSAPTLPATTLSDNCYSCMFSGCTSLTAAPALPATTLKTSCYYEMFRGCTSLTSAPILPATTMVSYCYERMFFGCVSLTSVSAFSATTLSAYCFYEMFSGCTALEVNTTVPGKEWKISVDSTAAKDWGTGMFTGTGGTLQGGPELNTTYYIKSALTPGSEENPWQIGAGEGDTVNAWTNGTGTLIVTGAGKMRAFAADGSGVPWPVADVSAVEVSGDVTSIGQNAWCGLGDYVTYNGLSSTAAKTMYNGFGESLDYGRIVFKGFLVEDGVVKATVALEKAKSLTNEWAEVKLEAKDVSVDSNGRIVIVHDAGSQDQGFYLVQPTK